MTFVDPFFYPPTASTNLDVYGKSQPLLALAQVLDVEGGLIVADDTSVNVVPVVQKTWDCDQGDLVDCSPHAPAFDAECSDGLAATGPTSSRTTRNGLIIVSSSVGPYSSLKEVHWEVGGEYLGPVTFPTYSCSVVPPTCDPSRDGYCVNTPTGDGDDNDQDYIDGSLVLTGTAGDGEILWEWTPVDSFDARVPIEYGISVSTGTPSANPTDSFITADNFLSTSLTNGATYYARVQAFLGVFTGVPSSPRTISNIASATPSGTPAGLTVSLSVRAHRT